MARALTLCFTLTFIATRLVLAQNATQPATRAEEIQQKRVDLSKQPPQADDDVVERFVEWAYEKKLTTLFSYGWKGVTPIFGGTMNGSGFGGGVQFLRRDLLNGNLVVRSSARGTIRQAYMLDFEVGLPELANDHAYLDFYVRQRNNPGVAFYGIGPDSRRQGRTNYLLEDTTLELSTGLKPSSWLRFGVAGGLLKTNVGPGQDSRFASTDRVYPSQSVPGLQVQSDFVRGGVLAHVDWRDNHLGPRAGGQYYGRFDYYDDRTNDRFSFRRLTAEAQQFIPLFNKKRVIAVRAKSILSYPSNGHSVPFYLQPSLGSSDDLRGFRPFRFQDDNTFVMNAEWRWEILANVDGAVFADMGKVFRRPGELNFKGLQKSYGGGLRFRAPMTGAMVLRIDGAASREGFQFWFVFNDIFAAPQIRTGRELSPPPGRLP